MTAPKQKHRPVLSPALSLLHSRKFLILLADTVFSAATLLITRHIAPDAATEVLALLALLQPVIYAVIAGIAREDAAGKRYGA